MSDKADMVRIDSLVDEHLGDIHLNPETFLRTIRLQRRELWEPSILQSDLRIGMQGTYYGREVWAQPDVDPSVVIIGNLTFDLRPKRRTAWDRLVSDEQIE